MTPVAMFRLNVPILLVVLAPSGQATGSDNRPLALAAPATTELGGTTVDLVHTLPGIAEPRQQVALSTSVHGVLKDVLVREGETVDARQILAVVDNQVVAAEVRLAEAMSVRRAAITEAESALQLADNLLSRLLKVQHSKAVSELEVDQARSSRDQARASLAQVHEQAREARINLELARAKLESHNIRAPFAGQVLRVEGRCGQTVTEADTVVTLANLCVLRTDVYVPMQWYGRLTVGAEYRLAASMPVNRPVAATLVATEPVIDAATQTFRCVFEIDNSDGQLPGGFTVRLIRPDGPDRASSHTVNSEATQ